MKTVGLITEYNPFHLGHSYHIKKAKELTGADYCVVIMSGNYVQRGVPSFVDKFTKTNVALNHGADLIIELPYCFSCASAEYFAYSAVKILDRLNCIDYICFGCECDDIHVLNKIADILHSPSKEFNELLLSKQKSGNSYALSRSAALCEYLHDESISSIINLPNNILAVEYLKALKKTGSTIKPVPLKRINAGYHDTTTNSSMYSASALRLRNDLKDTLLCIDSDYMTFFNKSYPIIPNDFSGQMILALNDAIFKNRLSDIFGINKDLENRIINNIDSFLDFESFSLSLKTKNIAKTAVDRALLHCMLQITDNDISLYINNDICDFIRILGFRKEAKEILSVIKKESPLKIITSLSDGIKTVNSLPFPNQKLFNGWTFADNLYRHTANIKYQTVSLNEYRKKLTVK